LTDGLLQVPVADLKALAAQHAAQLREAARFAADSNIVYDRQWIEAAANFLCAPRREPEAR